MESYENINIYGQNSEGKGICKINNIVTFVPFTLNGDKIDVEIIKKYKNYYEGKIIKVIDKSKERVEPKCNYFMMCGGCDLMHQDYKYQLEFKKNKVLNNLKHIGNIDINKEVEIISDNELYYRNHITLSINNNSIGFYKNNSYEIVDIGECIISNRNINNIIKNIKRFVEKYPNNNIEKISIKAYENTLINIIGNNFNLKDEFIKYVDCDSLYINNIHTYGIKNVIEYLGKYKYKISALSFFQKNTNMALKLYEYIKQFIDNNDNVLDLYCGTGSIGIFIADTCKSVTGIEIIKSAIGDARENAIINNINNISFICDKVENNIDKFNNINTIIVDPPRIGLSKSTINSILNIKPKKIIYVSCDSATLSRDLKMLNESYIVKEIRLFDLFPNTHHIETAVLLENKESL